MWHQLMKKMKDWFTEEVEESGQSTSKREYISGNFNTKQAVETKMSYQYPNERSFRFPLIPDEPSQTRKTEPKPKIEYDVPAFQRKQEKRHVQVEEQRIKQDDSQERKQPFKLSEVPSPIHGMHRQSRLRKEIENVPAFLRKDITWSKQTRSIRHQRSSYLPRMESDEKSEGNEPVETSPKLEKQVQDFSKHADASVMEPREEEPKEKWEAEKNSDWEPSQQIKRVDLHKEEKQSNSVPFNVMMTPKDKKRNLDKKELYSVDPVASVTSTDDGIKEVEKEPVPPIHLLNDPTFTKGADEQWVLEQIELLETTLRHFHVKAKVVNAMTGPSVTRFEVQPELGVKVSKIKNLSDDIKLNLAARDIRMEAPIPGKNAIGIEVPNPVPQAVGLQEILESEAFQSDQSPLTVALGLDISGRPMVTNLKKMPHGLIAGATGSGKSVCINSILISLLYKASHEDVRFLLIDPKMVELAPYNELPHLVAPVITDVKAATHALKWAVNEMEERYEKFVHEGVRDVERYNQKMEKQNRKADKLPYLIIVIDELADLMMVSPQDVEDAICRIAQKARACGIHLLLATQRPSVDVITGLIKANVPTRIAFSVSSQVDSRTIIDVSGAEKLLGRGDMLFVENGAGQSVRIQGAFVSDDEIERVTSFVRKSAPPQYLFEQEQLLEQVHMEEDEDELYLDAVDFVIQQNSASASLLQRRFKIGYNRAARLIDSMEANGIISEQKGSKPRDVLVSTSNYHTPS
ncbi:DNA translocase FtsK [Radiobacillus deserti]|uniref:DNA translocase FtsK n=1 Tax=Radiobacillus deserti TaxID=2594883 RepID=A0A516KHP1_9BACI|nr:DNA translocase FtsK [Radiobacillus deserti]QDP40902.1 DNA translocase FtsK [Radiobacillus deserti]